uniref:SesA n=1 Tax=Fusarium solani TaxID=169388 RepID=Q6PX80_FUSSL|nr:SesA [Fusarium haematococcum]
MEATVSELISSTIKSLEEGIRCHKDVEDDNGLREAFHEAGRGLSVVNQALQAAQGNSAREPQSAMNPLRVCNTKANISASIFKAVAQAPKTSRFEGYKEAVRQEGNGQTVEVLVVGMMKDVCALAENFAIQDQVKKLHETIEKLSAMKPSLPKEGPGHTFTNIGNGNQYNATDGPQNINQGGNQVTGGTFPGTVNFGSPWPQNPPFEHRN